MPDEAFPDEPKQSKAMPDGSEPYEGLPDEGMVAFAPYHMRRDHMHRADRLAMVAVAERATKPEPARPEADRLNGLLTAVARDRDRGAFRHLFQHFAPRLKAYLIRLGADASAAEELVQEVMLMVWRRADTFDPSQASAATWIFTIARNKRIDGIRRERRPEIDPDDPALVPAQEDAADRRLERLQDSARLRSALAGLPPEQVELLRLAYFEDKPHSAISAERGIPLGTVKSRLRLALEKLRKTLREDA